ncbi:MAG: magnesium/cobalt transporter CorA [Actinomycetota bacterium]|nr:magnesium/cobalt transporter CorA [Actinomycetota bacterium]
MMIISRQKDQIIHVSDRGDVAGLLADNENLIWIDIDRPTEDDLKWLSDTFGFHDLALEDVAKQRQRAKVETFDDHFFIVAHGVKPGQQRVLDIIELYLFVGANYLVSIRQEPFLPLDDLLKNRSESRYLRRGPDFLLYAILDMAVDTYFPAMERLDESIDKMDRKVLERPTKDDIERILAVKKQLVFMRKHISPQRDVINALISRDFPVISGETVIYFRDIYDHLMRLYDDIDFSRDQLTSQLDIYLSQVSNNLNDVMKRLTVFASIFMPITFLTGFFGMNFGYIQDRSPIWWLVITAFITVVAYGNYWWFKKRDWL